MGLRCENIPLFANEEPEIYSVNSTSGAPHAARIRATAEGGELANADTGFSQPTLPFFTVTEALQTLFVHRKPELSGFYTEVDSPKTLPVKPSNTI